MTPTVLDIKELYRDNAETKLRSATQEVKTPALNEVSYLAYEAVNSGHFGTGPFTVTMIVEDKGFTLTVKEG